MALRFVAVLLILPLLLITVFSSVGMAGGPPMVTPPVCAPPLCAPPSCAPPSCGPTGGPFALFGGILNACTNVCGAVIGIPSAIMGGLLAPPPPKRCAPPVCVPMVCAPPACAPPVCMPPTCAPPVCMPTPITKCKPGPRALYSMKPAVRYQAEPYYAPASYAPMVNHPAQSSYSSVPGQFAYVHHLLDAPFKLVSGTLTGSGLYNMSFATRTGDSKLSATLW